MGEPARKFRSDWFLWRLAENRNTPLSATPKFRPSTKPSASHHIQSTLDLLAALARRIRRPRVRERLPFVYYCIFTRIRSSCSSMPLKFSLRWGRLLHSAIRLPKLLNAGLIDNFSYKSVDLLALILAFAPAFVFSHSSVCRYILQLIADRCLVQAASQ